MYAFRFYAQKDVDDATSDILKTNRIYELIRRTNEYNDTHKNADLSDRMQAYTDINADLYSDPELGPDLLSPFGYSNDSVRPQQTQLDKDTDTVADYMNEERRQSFADYSGKTKDTVDMYKAPHKGISVLGINDPRYSIYDPMSLLHNIGNYISNDDYHKRMQNIHKHNELARSVPAVRNIVNSNLHKEIGSTSDMYQKAVQDLYRAAEKSGKNKYGEYFDTRYLMLPEYASKEKSPFYDVSAFLKALSFYADTTSNNRSDTNGDDSHLWLVKVDLDDMYSNDDRRKHFLHTGADDMHEFLAKKVTPYRYLYKASTLKDALSYYFDSFGNVPDAYNLKEANEAAADFMHKNFKVDPNEVWSDANLKDIYYDCSEPIYQAFCTTKLKPSVLKGAKGHFE